MMIPHSIRMILCVASLGMVFAAGSANGQSAGKITLQGNGITIRQALQMIEKQSSFTVAYDRTKVNVEKTITVNLSDATLTAALDAVLKTSGARYRISGNHIFITPKPAPAASPSPAAKTPVSTPKPAPVATPEPEPAPVPVAAQPEREARLLIKSNVLHLAAPMGNIGVEFAAGDRLSIDLPLSYGSASWIDSEVSRRTLFQPEVRFWPGRIFHGHFFGAFAHFSFSRYDEPFADGGQLYQNRNRYGAGISYGYRAPIGGRWGLEATLGAGAAYVDASHPTGAAPDKREQIGKVSAVMKAGITFSYILK